MSLELFVSPGSTVYLENTNSQRSGLLRPPEGHYATSITPLRPKARRPEACFAPRGSLRIKTSLVHLTLIELQALRPPEGPCASTQRHNHFTDDLRPPRGLWVAIDTEKLPARVAGSSASSSGGSGVLSDENNAHCLRSPGGHYGARLRIIFPPQPNTNRTRST